MSSGFLQPQHSFGYGSTCNDIHVIATVDGDGEKDFVLHSVGRHVALSSVADGTMKFLPLFTKDMRKVIAIELAPDQETVAVSFWTDRQQGHAEGSRSSQVPQGQASIAVYHLFSGSHMQTLSPPSTCETSRFTSMAFSSDLKRLAAVSDGGKSTLTSSEHQFIVLWKLDRENIEASATVPSGHVTSLRIHTISPDALCITTSGKQHFKVWAITESGLKLKSVLPSLLEYSEHFIDHQWTFSDKRAGAVLNKAGNTKTLGTAKMQADQLLLIVDGASKANSIQRSEETSVGSRTASAMVFGCMESPQYLELIATQPIPLVGSSSLLALAVHLRGFCVAGTQGYFAAFEIQDDTQRPYTLVGSFSVSGCRPGKTSPSWTQLCVSPSGETLIAHAKDSWLYNFPLGKFNNPGRNDTKEALAKHFVPLVSLAPHDGPILAMDICANRPVIATCGNDHTVSLWHHTSRQCTLSYHQERQPNDKHCSLALHPSGFQLIIGFSEETRLYSVVFQGLKPLYDLSLTKCNEIRYAHGGHQFACAAGITITVYASISMALLHTLSSHLLPIRCLVWTEDDLSIFSAGTDGNVRGWDLVGATEVEEASYLNHVSAYHALAVHLPQRSRRTVIKGPDASRALVFAASVDGALKELSWETGDEDAARVRDLHVIFGDDVDGANIAIFTALVISSTARCVFGGTSTGTICVFGSPIADCENHVESFTEFPLHAGEVAALRIANDDSQLFTAGTDGVIFVLNLWTTKETTNGGQVTVSNRLGNDPRFSSDLVQISLGDLEKNTNSLAELTKQLENMKSDNEFAMRRKSMEFESQIKNIQENNAALLNAKETRMQDLRDDYEKRIQTCHAAASRRASHHVQVTYDLENQYEHKLALEMERYDVLSEEIEAIQQRCEGLLEAQRREHEVAIRGAEARTKSIEKELRQQIDRLHEDARHNEQMFREVLDQQEHEYESELQQLMTAAQTELATERESTGEARGLIQTRNTKISRLEKRMDELKTSSHARNVVLTAEKVRNAKLEATLRHFKRHMEERESTLEDKELAILHLRRKNVTLDNFRFVLDHRVQQLMEERGPVTNHVGGLEAHISAMYDELESEYYKMKRQGHELDSKELKIHTLGREVETLRGFLREREAYIASFKRELSTMVSISAPKDLEDAVKNSYHQFVREEPPRNKIRSHAPAKIFSNSKSNIPSTRGTLMRETGSARQAIELNLQQALTEAHSQRHCIQQTAGNLKHRLSIVKTGAERQQRLKLEENSHLISECNQLRGEHLCLSREVNHLRQVVRDHKSSKRNQHHAPSIVHNMLGPKDSESNLQHADRLPLPDGPFAMSGNSGHESRKNHGNIKSAYRGSTRALSLWSAQEARILQMSNQLDENTRIIGTQNLEMQRLRAQLT